MATAFTSTAYKATFDNGPYVANIYEWEGVDLIDKLPSATLEWTSAPVEYQPCSPECACMGDGEGFAGELDSAAVTELTAALAALGDSSQAIADTFRATGMRGTPANGRICAIANYLRAAFRTEKVIFNGYRADVLLPDGRRAAVAAPHACTAFAKQFDRHAYPELIGDPPAIEPVPVEASPAPALALAAT